MDPPAQIVEQQFQSPGQAVEAPLHVPEPVTELNVGHEVQQRRRVVGRRPHVFDEIVERVHEFFVFDEPAHAAVQVRNTSKPARLRQRAVKPNQFPKRVEPLGEIALFGDAGEFAANNSEIPKPFGAAAGDLF
jgi:hypothetical protein